MFVDPIICRSETKRRLQERLILFYTGLTRSADGILKEQSQNAASPGEARAVLSNMKRQADALRASLENDDLQLFGEILHEGWLLKKTLASGISNPSIDEWYAAARANGATGGKLLGAGGGGFLLFDADPDRHDALEAALPGLRRTPFAFEPQGSKIVYVEEN